LKRTEAEGHYFQRGPNRRRFSFRCQRFGMAADRISTAASTNRNQAKTDTQNRAVEGKAYNCVEHIMAFMKSFLD
jgi:hypothetical protein